MAWYSDEEYELRQDCREKKSIAASAFKQRTHCGKGGCTLPSDYKTKKELKAMNGEVKSYRLNEPMDWGTFKGMPDDLKSAYLNWIRNEFGASDVAIAEMMGIHAVTFGKYMRVLGLTAGKNTGSGKRKWNKEKFLAWSHGVDPDAVNENAEESDESIPETPVEPAGEKIDISVESKIEENQGCSCGHTERKRAVPANGKMTFDGPIEEIVETLRMLLAGAEVTLDVAWTVVESEE